MPTNEGNEEYQGRSRRQDQSPGEDLSDLLDADRDLSEEELAQLKHISESTMRDIEAVLNARARVVYQCATPEEFTQCVREHLDGIQTLVLTNAEVYHCPVCGRLLKDRRSPLASSILVERGRLAALLMEAEQSPPGPERRRLWARFRAALGLGPR